MRRNLGGDVNDTNHLLYFAVSLNVKCRHVGIFASQKQGMLTCLFCYKLHVQHWLWRYRLGSLLRPLIPISSEMRMVHIGTGYASWV